MKNFNAHLLNNNILEKIFYKFFLIIFLSQELKSQVIPRSSHKPIKITKKSKRPEKSSQPKIILKVQKLGDSQHISTFIDTPNSENVENRAPLVVETEKNPKNSKENLKAILALKKSENPSEIGTKKVIVSYFNLIQV